MKQEAFRLRPTGLWLIFGPILGCMWLAAVNYANNLVYAILYLVGALSFISIFHTRRNLAGLRVEHVRIQPAFAGEEIRLEIYLRNVSKHIIYGIFFSRADADTGLTRPPILLRAPEGRGVRIDAGDSCAVEVVLSKKQPLFKWWRFVPLPAAGSGDQRGIYRFESLQVKTAYPFGLFWTSFRVPLDMEYYVYPKPRGTSDWPGLHPGGEQGSPVSMKPGDDFAGVRAYMPGESLRHVDWKAFARGRPLSIKQFTGGSGHELWLDAAEMKNLPLETRLSQLALWIVQAEKEEIPYALKLGRTTIPLGLGPAQSQRALEALAVAGLEPGSSRTDREEF